MLKLEVRPQPSKVMSMASPLLALAVVAWGLFFGVRFVLRRGPGSGVGPGAGAGP